MTTQVTSAPRSQPSSGAIELAIPLAIAVRIEPELIRAVRIALCPALDVDAESDLWFSSWVGFRGSRFITLRADVLVYLREQLAARLSLDGTLGDRARDAWRIVSQVHASSPPALIFEEYLTWLSVQAEPPDWNRELLPALASIIHERRIGIAEWFTRAWKRVPFAVQNSTRAWQIRQLDRSESLPGLALDSHVAEQLDISHAAEVDRSLDRINLRTRVNGQALTITDSKEVSQGVEVSVPDTDPRLVQVKWLEGESCRDELVRLPVGESIELSVGATQYWVHTPAGQVYEVGDPASSANLRWIAIHLIGFGGTGFVTEAIWDIWRLLRAVGIDASMGAPDKVDSGERAQWVGRRISRIHALVLVSEGGWRSDESGESSTELELWRDGAPGLVRNAIKVSVVGGPQEGGGSEADDQGRVELELPSISRDTLDPLIQILIERVRSASSRNTPRSSEREIADQVVTRRVERRISLRPPEMPYPHATDEVGAERLLTSPPFEVAMQLPEKSRYAMRHAK